MQTHSLRAFGRPTSHTHTRATTAHMTRAITTRERASHQQYPFPYYITNIHFYDSSYSNYHWARSLCLNLFSLLRCVLALFTRLAFLRYGFSSPARGLFQPLVLQRLLFLLLFVHAAWSVNAEPMLFSLVRSLLLNRVAAETALHLSAFARKAGRIKS